METIIIIAIVTGAAFFLWKLASQFLAQFRSEPSQSQAQSCGSCGGCSSRCSTEVSRVLTGITILAVMGGTQVAQAADTVETWDVGATDVDFYMGTENLGLPREEGMIFGDLMLGYGLAERFSGYIGTALQADRTLGQGDHQHYLGLFGTPMDTDHVDFDLFLGFKGSASGLTITPSFELNLDRDSDMSSYGFYLRTGVVLSHESADPEEVDSTPAIGTVVTFTSGVYWSITNHSQLFLEYSTGYLPSPAAKQDIWEIDHLHIGFNQLLTETIELITEVNWALEKTDGATPWGGFVGIIVTLPSTRGEHL